MLYDELLISEVQLNPCLWNLSNKEYSNREVKKKKHLTKEQKIYFPIGKQY
jgi:hypothetical protein